MKSRTPAHEIVLHPGDWWFGGGDTRARTVLGSCIAITLWHPQLRVGGMCHYMLPQRVAPGSGTADGRYGDEALQALTGAVLRTGRPAAEYEAKLFGGGHMFSAKAPAVPGRNISAGRALLQRHGFACKAEHVGGLGHREVVFDLVEGHVWVRQAPPSVFGELA